ncbi:hypothetical protein SAMN04488134_10344 [Amphibacillus marinus]|uniref:DUF4352 domain-containing protein n=1 Tax=Amphibacillus marinus TaxID=872970 RepID=A0A1H8L1B7_9BACI|nr:hypothetical protein [Amphibacillus marinus]SEN98934.1 hypothetical protein SAMN04488134_10344 [Amphibacillus marinus]
MKKFLLLLLALTMFIVACGDDEGETTAQPETNDTEETTEGTDDSEEVEEEPAESTGAAVGETISNEMGDFTQVSRTEDVGTFESGPIILNIEKVNGVEGTINPDYVDLMEGEEIEYIQVDMTVESTSEDPVNFYASQATITTSTGEQLEPDMFLSDHIDGEYLGQVTKSGTIFYVLENSKAEDVESIKMFFGAPNDDSFSSLGDEITIDVTLNK